MQSQLDALPLEESLQVLQALESKGYGAKIIGRGMQAVIKNGVVTLGPDSVAPETLGAGDAQRLKHSKALELNPDARRVATNTPNDFRGNPRAYAAGFYRQIASGFAQRPIMPVEQVLGPQRYSRANQSSPWRMWIWTGQTPYLRESSLPMVTNTDVFDFRLYDLIQDTQATSCLLYTSPSPRDATLTRMPSSA